MQTHYFRNNHKVDVYYDACLFLNFFFVAVNIILYHEIMYMYVSLWYTLS